MISPIILGFQAAIVLGVKPTEHLREQIALLLRLGVNQKEVATRLGVSETTFSRWYRRVPDSKGRPAKIPAEAFDSFDDYAREFSALNPSKETAQAPAVAVDPFRKTGTTGDEGHGPSEPKGR